jgi:hypothetical protein
VTHVSITGATTMEETSDLKISERMTLWNIQGPEKEGNGWRIRTGTENTYYKREIL